MTIDLLGEQVAENFYNGNLMELAVQVDSEYRLINHDEYTKSKNKAIKILQMADDKGVDTSEIRKNFLKDINALEKCIKTGGDLMQLDNEFESLHIRRVLYAISRNGKYTLYMLDSDWNPSIKIDKGYKDMYKCYLIYGDILEILYECLDN